MVVKKPRYFAFGLTDRCQSHCRTCSGWQTPKECKQNELSTNDWKFVFNSLHNWLGNFDFIFSGGEPFLREDIFELADYAAQIGLIPKVITNGLALKNKCEKLINSGFSDITISLNGVKNPEIHNFSRGLNNAFKITSDVIQNLAYLNRKINANKTILLSTVIMPSNLTELVPLAEFAHTNQIGINYQLLDGGDSFFTAYDIRSEYNKMYSEMRNEIMAAIDKLVNLKEKGYLIYNTENQLNAFKESILNSPDETSRNESYEARTEMRTFSEYTDFNDISDKINPSEIDCNIQTPFTELYPEKAAKCSEASCRTGDYNFLIDPYGNVRICFSFEPIGNLRTMLPENIWNSEEAEKMRKKIAVCNKSCKLLNCNYHEDEE